eukprot:4373225-Alexandrium_andersonii.AAC.1
MRDSGTSPDQVRARLGLPHIAGWNGALMWLKEKTEQEDQKKELEECLKEMAPKGWKYQWEFVKFCRIAKMWEPS